MLKCIVEPWPELLCWGKIKREKRKDNKPPKKKKILTDNICIPGIKMFICRKRKSCNYLQAQVRQAAAGSSGLLFQGQGMMRLMISDWSSSVCCRSGCQEQQLLLGTTARLPQTKKRLWVLRKEQISLPVPHPISPQTMFFLREK